ncbi:hypothetical protein AB0I89_23925 [Micromonospora sp. NPDC049801]|uniref:hypothetical protein n=1 Tax=unclassified Micromonospora TaxID=2617518 RepID=UPI00340A61D9
MISMMIGAMILALWVKVAAETAGDLVTTLRASKAGEWSLIDKQRDRKAAKAQSRREAMSKAWQSTRAARNRKAGGTGQYRPGMAAYLGDVYHGVWEDQLEKRKAKRASRPQVGPDGKRPAPSRMDRAVEGKVEAQRTKTGYTGRIKQAGRLLIDPVGEGRQPSGVMPPPASPPPAPAPVADGPRTACQVCGDSLTERDGVWSHPAESTCETARRPDGGYHVPWPVKQAAPELYRLNRAEGRSGALGETQTARDLRGMFGDRYPQHVYEQAAADATHTPAPEGGWMPDHDKVTQVALDALADADPDGHRRPKNLDDAEAAIARMFPRLHPEVIAEAMALADKVHGCNSCGRRRGAKPPCVHQQAAENRLREARARMATTNVADRMSADMAEQRKQHGACSRCGDEPNLPGRTVGTACAHILDQLSTAAEAEWARLDPNHTGDSRQVGRAVFDALSANNTHGWTRAEIQNAVKYYKHRPADHLTTGTESSNGGTTMNTGTADLVDYNTAVAEHERALETLREQHAQAVAFEQHAAGLLAAVEAMDANRSEVATALAPLSEGMEGSRFGADATQGSAEAVSALTAGSIAEVQENIEAAVLRNEQWKAELAESIEGVQGSLQHVKSQFGELAAGVQETGIDGRALEEH